MLSKPRSIQPDTVRNPQIVWPSTRRGISWRGGIAAGVVVVVAVGGLWYWLAMISRQRMFEEKMAEARQHLQLSRDEEALESLSVQSDGGAPSEFRYLKALTLDRLRRYEPANAEIRRAIADAPENPKYKGLELKMRMLARERSAVDQLIELNRDYASTAAVALFAAYGFQAKGILLQAEGNPKAAEYHQTRKGQTLDTAITMAADIPELHPELLTFAIREKKSVEALQIIDRLLKLDPENIPLRSRKVGVLVSLRKIDEAAKLAETLYVETGRNAQGAQYLASVLSQTSESSETELLFEELVQRFPRSTVVVSKFAVYLTRFGRLPAAQKQIDDAIARQTNATEREVLAFTSITLPIEVNAPEVAEEFLRKHRKHLQDDLLADYFEARILYLRKQYSEAIQKMLQIVGAAKQGKGGSRVFATEALTWVQRILAEKVMTEQLDRVLESTDESTKPRIKVATEEQLKKLQEDNPDKATPVSQNDSPSPTEAPQPESPATSVEPDGK